ncbi:MAG: FliM/FliN family flagellar motor switch protein [Terracidiphilus sp.]
MNSSSQKEAGSADSHAEPLAPQKAQSKVRSIHKFDFRQAGRLSNEDARSLTALHETFARNLSIALDAYLGAGLEVKLQTLDRLPVKEHVASVPPASYIARFSLPTIPCIIIVECDMDLVSPIIDLLMGGNGTARGGDRELSEIDEEILQEVLQLIVRQAEVAWRLPEFSLVANRRVKPHVLHQSFSPNEKVNVVKFQLEIAGTSGSFQLVFPAAFAGALIKTVKADHPQKRNAIRYFPTPPLRERILDCDMEVAAELTGLRVSARDLIALQPGSVLKLRAPVNAPGMLTAGGRALFEAVPVRNGPHRAAQIGRKATTANWKRG